MYTERFLQMNKHLDGLLSLAWAMEQEKHDDLQSKWVAKVYVFLCDFIQQGLHRRVRPHLGQRCHGSAPLSHSETTAARHGIAKQARMLHSRI